jgi:hypothetical protein
MPFNLKIVRERGIGLASNDQKHTMVVVEFENKKNCKISKWV